MVKAPAASTLEDILLAFKHGFSRHPKNVRLFKTADMTTISFSTRFVVTCVWCLE